MVEFDELFENDFFIIDSNKLNEINSKFYGFAITDNKLVYDICDLKNEKLDGTGSYIYINKSNNTIEIYQDNNGTFGIYIYNDEKNNFFVISNSFIKLIEYLKDKVPLSLNKDYANSFLSAEFCSIAYKQTMVNEVMNLPHDMMINININEKTLRCDKINYHEKSIKLESEEGLKILDSWFYKWTNLINAIYTKVGNIKVDLSGGFDSRVILTLLLSSGIDMSKIYINSFMINNKTFMEDYEIASEIAKDFNFKLNDNILNIPKHYFKELGTSINSSYYVRLGLSKQMNWNNFILDEPVYHVKGFSGELIRHIYKNRSIESHVLSRKDRALDYSKECAQSTEKILKYNFDEFLNETKEKLNELDIVNIQYRFTRNRFHYGKSIIELYLGNTIVLSPFMDPLINKLKIDDENNDYDYLLPTLIYLRYCPKLLSYKFEGGRSIPQKTIDYACQINEKYPFEAKPFEVSKFILTDKPKKNFSNMNSNNSQNFNQYNCIMELFESDSFKKFFISLYSEELYDKIYEHELELPPNSPDSDLQAIVAIFKVYSDVLYSQQCKINSPYEWIEHFEKTTNDKRNTSKINYLNELEIYNTARIDLKNVGLKDNDIEILDISDKDCKVLKPLWMQNNTGLGLSFESTANILNLKVRCINDGDLDIMLKSKNVCDISGTRLPIYINYKKVLINSKDVLDDNRLASHDNQYVIKKGVKNNEILNIHIEWEPFNKKCSFKNNNAPLIIR